MKTYNGIKYAVKRAHKGLLLIIPAFGIHEFIEEADNFKEADLLNYI